MIKNSLISSSISTLLLVSNFNAAESPNLEDRRNLSQREELPYNNKRQRVASGSSKDRLSMSFIEMISRNIISVNQHVDENENTPLIKGIKEGDEELVSFCLEHGADINRINKNGTNAFMAAAKKGNIELIRQLYNKGLNINTQNLKGNTALHKAAQQKHETIIDFLLLRFADYKKKNREGKDLAKICEEKELDPLLERMRLAGVIEEPHEEVDLILFPEEMDVGIGDNSLEEEDDRENEAHSSPERFIGPLYHRSESSSIVELYSERRSRSREASESVMSRYSYPDFDRWDEPDLNDPSLQANDQLVLSEQQKTKKLFDSAQNGDESSLRDLLENYETDVDQQDQNGASALHIATRNNHVNIVRLLINFEANFNMPDNRGWTPLHLSAMNGNEEIIDLLISKNVQLDPVEKEYGCTPLVWAVDHAHLGVVKKLCEAGADINYTFVFEKELSNVLITSIEAGKIDTIRYLLDKGVNVEAPDSSKVPQEALHKFNGEKIRLPRSTRTTPLMHASALGQVDTVSLLTWYVETLNGVDIYWGTALTYAVKERKKEVVRLLLDSGARGSLSKSPIIEAVWPKPDWGMIKLLLNGGAEFSTTERRALNDNIEIKKTIEKMIKTGKHVKKAASSGNVRELKRLLENDALTGTQDSRKTALMLAAEKGHVDAVSLLLQYDVFPNRCISHNGVDALMLAAGKGHLSTVKALVEGGANPTFTDRRGRSAESIARKKGYIEIADFLKSKVQSNSL